MYTSRGSSRRVGISLDANMESFVFDDPARLSGVKRLAGDDSYSVADLSSIVDGQNTVSFRAAVRSREPGCFSALFGSSEDIRIYAPSCFSIVFSVDVIDLQADSPSIKGEWFAALQAFLNHVNSAGGQAFRTEMLELRNKKRQEERVAAVRAARPSNPTLDVMREKYRPNSRAGAAGYRPLPTGVEELSFD
jgi:hypothetical protein